MRAFDVMLDMNRDGAVTISDMALWGKWFACLPGNLTLEGMAFIPRIASFFEIKASPLAGYDSFYGWPAWIMSVLTWLVLVGWIGELWDPTHNERARQEAVRNTYRN